jgi:hypothetical protein
LDPIEGAEIIEVRDNAISMHSLSDREVVIVFPGAESYTAVLVLELYFVGTAKARFGKRVGEYGPC